MSEGEIEGDTVPVSLTKVEDVRVASGVGEGVPTEDTDTEFTPDADMDADSDGEPDTDGGTRDGEMIGVALANSDGEAAPDVDKMGV